MLCRGIADDEDDEEEEEEDEGTSSIESIGHPRPPEVGVQSVAELESKLLLLRWRGCEPALTLSNGFEKFWSCSRSHTTSSTPPDLATADSKLFDSLTFNDPSING